MNWDKIKKRIILHIPYVFLVLLGTKLGQAWRLAEGADPSGKLLHLMDGLRTAFRNLSPSFVLADLCVGIVFAVIVRLAVYIKGKNAKKFRKNIEYGSARWGSKDDIKPFMDVQTIARRECANCISGNCLLLDDGEPCICPQRISRSLWCRYFIDAVLPRIQNYSSPDI